MAGLEEKALHIVALLHCNRYTEAASYLMAIAAAERAVVRLRVEHHTTEAVYGLFERRVGRLERQDD